MSQQVTVAYNEVIKDKGKPHNQWSDNALLRAFKEKGFLEMRSGGNQIEVSLDIQINAGADILASDTTAVSESETDVLGGAVYSWSAIVSPINFTMAAEARSAGDNNKVPFLRSLAENAIESHDKVIEAACFTTTTDTFYGLQTHVADSGQPNVGGIDGSSAAYWRNVTDTYQSDGSDIELALTAAYNSAAKGTGSEIAPSLIVSGSAAQAIFEAQLQPLQRYNTVTKGVGGFKALGFKDADWIFSQYGGTRIYGLNPRAISLVVNKDFFRKLEPTVRMTAAAMKQQLIFSHAQFVLKNPSRCFVITQA